MAAIAEIPVGLSLGERRIGEQRRGDGLQGQADAHLPDHVGLVAEIQIDLHRGAAQHHVEAEIAARRHIGAHDVVARLGHYMDVLAPPFGLKADADEGDAEIVRHMLDLGEMGMDLGTGLMKVGDRRPGQLELASGLETH